MHSQKTPGARAAYFPALLCAAVLAACGGSAGSNDSTDGASVDGELNVGVRVGSIPNAAVEALIATQGEVLIADERTSFYRVALKPGVSPAQARAAFVHPDIVFVEPNYLAWGYAAPSDPYYATSQYSAKVQAELEAGWDAYAATSATAGAVVLAVLDTGIRATHDDLASKVDGTNWQDYVTIGNATVLDDHGHGTQIAGIAAAEVNNAAGVAGVAGWFGAGADPGLVSIMPVKVADANNVSNHAAIAAGMSWAVAHGADIILVSLGSATPSWTLQKAVQDAYAAGVLVVAAAGNDATGTARYPAAYQGLNQGVLSVSSATPADLFDSAHRANYGAWVNVLAPGSGLTSTGNAGDADYVTSLAGTSYAAAHVAGIAAVVWSAYVPSTAHGAGVLTVDEVRNAVLAGVDSYGRSGAGTIAVSGGRVNLQKALAAAANIQSHAASAALPGSVIFNATSLRGGASAVGTVVLTDPAPISTVITLASSDDVHLTVPASVTVLRGARSATFAVATTAVTTTTAVTVTATGGGVSATGSIDLVAPGVSRVAVAPTTAVGGATVSGTITLAGAAPAGGVEVTLASDSGYATFVTTVVTVPATRMTATFTVLTTAVTAQQRVHISAAANGTTATATLTLNPALASVSFTPTSVKGGANATLRIALNGPQATDIQVDVNITDPGNALTPESIVTTTTIVRGQSSKALTVTTRPVAGQATVTATASYAGVTTAAATLLVNVPAISTLTASTGSLIWWDASHVTTGAGTLTLDANAATTTTVYLSSSDSTLAVPSTVSVPAGARTVRFSVSPAAVVSSVTATVSASLVSNFAVKKTCTFQLKPALLNMTLAATQVAAGGTVRGTVTLSAAAPAGDFDVALASDSASATVDPAVTVSAGRTSATFDVVSVSSLSGGTANITATVNGVTKRLTLRITAPSLTGVTFNPTSAAVGASVTGTVTLSAAALARTPITLVSNDTTAVPVVSPLYISTGATTGTFTFTAGTVAAQRTVSVTATLGSTSRSGTIVIRPQALSVTLGAATVAGGDAVSGTVTLGTAAPTGGTVVTLSAADPLVLSTTVRVAAGARTATFSVPTLGVDADALATVTATAGTNTAVAGVTVREASVPVLSVPDPVDLTTAAVGDTYTITITLDAAAGPTNGAITIGGAIDTNIASLSSVVGAARGARTATIVIRKEGPGQASFSFSINGASDPMVLVDCGP